TLGPAADRTIMIRTAAVMAATENHPVRRVSRVSGMRSEGRAAGRPEGAAGSGAAAGPAPGSSSLSLTESPPAGRRGSVPRRYRITRPQAGRAGGKTGQDGA